MISTHKYILSTQNVLSVEAMKTAMKFLLVNTISAQTNTTFSYQKIDSNIFTISRNFSLKFKIYNSSN